MAAKGEDDVLSEEIFDVTCTICSRKNRVKEARKYCTDCRKNLCADCVVIHAEHIGSHILVDEFGEEEEAILLTEKCGTHKKELIKLYCVDHDALVCSACALSVHRKCHDLKHITESIKDLNKEPNIQGVPDQLRSALQAVGEMIAKLDRHVDALSEKESKFLDEIEDYTARLLAKIEEIKRNATSKVTDKQQQLAAEATGKSEAIANAKKDIGKCLEDAGKLDGREANLFILYKKGQSLVRNVETLCRDSENLIQRSALVFRPDLGVEECLFGFNSLVVCVEKYKASQQDNTAISVAPYSESCDIQACCLLPDGTVLLLDDFNKRLKHVDPSTSGVKDVCDLEGNLWGITLISQHKVAVCTGSQGVQVISLFDKKSHKQKMSHISNRILQNNGQLFISDASCVYVRDLTWDLLRTICTNEPEEEMFSYIFGMAMNKVGDRLYVTDSKKGLICTDRDGQEMFRRSEKELGLSRAYGVCTDQRGNVLVCGNRSNNVVQLTEDGQVVGEILSQADGIESPKCMCYDGDSRMLCVGGRTPKLLIYKLV